MTSASTTGRGAARLRVTGRVAGTLAVDAVIEAAMATVLHVGLHGGRAVAETTRRAVRMLGPAGLIALAVLVVLIVVVAASDIDLGIAHAAGTLTEDEKAFYELVTQLGDSAGYIIGSVAAIVVLYAMIARWPERAHSLNAWRWLHRAQFFALAVIGSGLASILLKMVFGRARPRMMFRDDVTGFHPFTFASSGDFGSFPSGHSTTTWAVAFALIAIFGRWGLIAVPIAAFASATRTVLAAHFLGDVLAGMLLAALSVVVIRCWLDPNRTGPHGWWRWNAAQVSGDRAPGM